MITKKTVTITASIEVDDNKIVELIELITDALQCNTIMEDIKIKVK